MRNRRGKLLGFMLTLALIIGLMSGTQQAEATDSTYTITIPSTLDVQDSGWNELPGGISASGNLADGVKLVINASSDNGFKFVHSDYNTQTVPYDFCASSDDLTPITTWEFASLSSNAATTQTAGINVADYRDMPGGIYNETVTFTTEIVDTRVDLSKLTADYEAQDGDTLTGTLGSAGYKITVAAGATITLSNVDITSITNDYNKDGAPLHPYAGINCLGDATIILSDTNTVKGGHRARPSIHIASGDTLTIRGSGSLTASSNSRGAGIGGGWNIACGNIVIEGGTISATGGNNGAGIGGGNETPCGNITITTDVTSVTATKGSEAPNSIGPRDSGTCGIVTIGGTITGSISESPYTYPGIN